MRSIDDLLVFLIAREVLEAFRHLAAHSRDDVVGGRWRNIFRQRVHGASRQPEGQRDGSAATARTYWQPVHHDRPIQAMASASNPAISDLVVWALACPRPGGRSTAATRS